MVLQYGGVVWCVDTLLLLLCAAPLTVFAWVLWHFGTFCYVFFSFHLAGALRLWFFFWGLLLHWSFFLRILRVGWCGLGWGIRLGLVRRWSQTLLLLLIWERFVISLWRISLMTAKNYIYPLCVQMIRFHYLSVLLWGLDHVHVHIIHQVGHLRHGVNDVVGLRCSVPLRKEGG